MIFTAVAKKIKKIRSRAAILKKTNDNNHCWNIAPRWQQSILDPLDRSKPNPKWEVQYHPCYNSDGLMAASESR